MRFRIFYLITGLLFLIATPAKPAEINSIGVPYIHNYLKSGYFAGNQNWSISRDKQGRMYFGNSDGLLVFDGGNWKTYRLPNRLMVLAFAFDGIDRIYTGAFGEFGFWQYNKSGNLLYHSLTGLLPQKTDLKDEIWKIYVDGERVIFQSFGSIYIYDKGKIKVLRGPEPFLFLFKAGERFFVEVLTKGLYELKGEKLVLIENSKLLGSTGILSIMPYRSGSYLLATAKNGIFVYDGTSIQPWINQANDFLKSAQLNNGVQVMGRYYAFGTILGGLVILDQEGRIVQRISKADGLQNNTVLSLYADKDNNLWAGLDNGIDRIELNSSLYFYLDKTGRFGTVYSSIIFNNKIYLGTNQGLFCSDWIGNNSGSFQSYNFSLIPESQGQVWDLSLIDGRLLCGHNEGTFAVEGNAIRKVSDVKGGWVIKKLNSNPDILIQGTYTGLALFRKNSKGDWQFYRQIEGFGEPSRFVEQDSKGQIWVAHAYRGLYKLTLSDDLTRVKSSKFYSSSFGLPSTYHINIFNLENRIVFSSDSGFYVYDDISDKFYPYEQLNKKLYSFATANKIIREGPQKYWFIKRGKVALVDLLPDGKISIDSTRFRMLKGRMVQDYENISRISSSLDLISLDDGFAIYNRTQGSSMGNFAVPGVLIGHVESTNGKVSTITESASNSRGISVPFRQNDLRIFFSLPYYREAQVKYQYYLEGYSGEWSAWSPENVKEFTGLSAGDYVFKVRARVDGKEVTREAIFSFTILPPWYASTFALGVYLVLGVFLIFLIRRYYLLKLKAHQEAIRVKLEQQKAEELRKEALANEQEIVRLKNEQLIADLESKNRELASSAMNIVYKNELLQKIKEEIADLKDHSGKKLTDEQLKRIQKVIDEGMNDERDWNLFEKSFNEAHENFFKKLKQRHPELVPNDLKLCAYLRMNMSSKELASLLNISVRGVEIRRYRLRKKLNLEHDKNLVEFLMEL